jgi:ligand-binding sensor domain-containing protein
VKNKPISGNLGLMWCAATALLCTLGNAITAQDLGVKTFKLQQDNQPFKINCLFKSANGYLFAGSTNGLYTFDGSDFKKINFAEVTARDTITAMFEDNNRQLWVGCKSGRIARKVNSRLEYFQPQEGTP